MTEDADAVHQVLGLALSGVEAPASLEPGPLLARAGRIRRRRRIAAGGAAAVALLAGGLVAAGVPARHGGAPAVSPVTSSPSPRAATVTDILTEELPSGLGLIEPVPDPQLLAHQPAWAAQTLRAQRQSRSFSGAYAVRPAGGGVGLLYVDEATVDDPQTNGPSLCGPPPGLPKVARNPTCTSRRLPGGAVLTVWAERAHTFGSGSRRVTFGAANCAELDYPDGRWLSLAASAGAAGGGGPGHLLAAPPLTLRQVGALVQLPFWWHPPANGRG